MLKDNQFKRVPVIEIDSRGLAVDVHAFNPVTLVVDDEPLIADTLAAILSKSGYSAFVAYNGEAGLEFASVVPPQLLITDVMMPGMSGFDLALEIRRTVPDCKIIVLSGIVEKLSLASRQQYLHYDFHLLSKPTPVADLLTLVSTLGLKTQMAAQPGPRSEGKRISAAERRDLKLRKLKERIARKLTENKLHFGSGQESLRG
jgi:DNA-binding response OmpR family regulator